MTSFFNSDTQYIDFFLLYPFQIILTCKLYNQKLLLNPVPYGYGPSFCYWNFQHIYTGSTKAKINPKKKEFIFSVKWRCFLPIIHLATRHPTIILEETHWRYRHI